MENLIAKIEKKHSELLKNYRPGFNDFYDYHKAWNKMEQNNGLPEEQRDQEWAEYMAWAKQEWNFFTSYSYSNNPPPIPKNKIVERIEEFKKIAKLIRDDIKNRS